MLKDITGNNSVASTNELESEVSTLNQSITNTSNELNASINATKLQFNSSIKQAINLKDDGTSYVDAGNVLDINNVPDIPDTPDDDVDLDNYDIILEVEQVKSDVGTLKNNVTDMSSKIGNIESGIKTTNDCINNIQKNKAVNINEETTNDINYPTTKAVVDAIMYNNETVVSQMIDDTVKPINTKLGEVTETYPIADYIIERGTSEDGIWTYRMWSNGDAECWATFIYNMTRVTITANRYGYHCITSGYKFPKDLFIGMPFIDYNAGNDSGQGGLTGCGQGVVKAAKANATKENTGYLYVDFPAGLYAQADWILVGENGTDKTYTFPEGQYLPIQVSIEAKGRWKEEENANE